MNEEIQIVLDDDTVNFTPDGKIFVLDAICAMAETDKADRIWRKMQADNPQIVHHVEAYECKKGRPIPVADGAGWEAIQDVLFEYLVSSEAVRATVPNRFAGESSDAPFAG